MSDKNNIEKSKIAKSITEAKQEKPKLEDDEILFNSMFNNHNSIMFLIEPSSGKIIEANRAASSFYGYTIDELKKMNINSINQLSADEIFEQMHRVVSEEKNNFVFPHKCANGEIRTVEVHSSTIQLNGQILLFSIIHDVTKISNTERAFGETTQMLANVIEGTNVGTWNWNIANGDLFLNERWAEIIGYTLEELEPIKIDTWERLAHPDDLEIVNEKLRKHFLGETKNYEAEVRMKHKNGTWVWVLDRGKVNIWDKAGKPVFMAGTHQDITERKKREEFESKLLNLTIQLTSMTSTEIPIALQFAMSEIGDYIDADRAYIFEFDPTGTLMDNTYEWCNNGIQPEIDNLKNIPCEAVPMWMKAIEKHENIIIPSVKNLSSEWQAEKEGLEPQGIKSLIVIPIIILGKVIGFVGLDSVLKERCYSTSEVNVLQVWSNLLAGLINKRKFEEILSQTKNNYEAFFNTINDLLFVLDEKGNIIHTNITTQKRLEYSKEELIGKSVLMVHPEERRAEAGRIVGEMLNGSSEFCPVPLLTKSGKQIPVETKVAFGKWNGETVIFGVSKDITDIKFSEEKFSKTFYLSPSAAGINDLDSGKYIEVNDAFVDLFGFTKDEVIGKTAIELGIMSKETKESILNKADKNGSINKASAELRAKNGDIKSVFLSSENIYVQDKRLRFTLVNDVTENKLTEEALKKSEEKFRTIVSSMTDSIIILNKELELISYFGRPENAYIIQNIEMLKADIVQIKEENILSFREKANQVLKGIPATHDFESVDSKNGKTFWHFSLSAMYDDEHNLTGVLVVGRDLTIQNNYMQKVETSEFKLSEAQRIAKLANWEYNTTTKVLVWSQQMYQILECEDKVSQNNYDSFIASINSSDRDNFLQVFEELIKNNKPFDVALRLVTQKKSDKIVKIIGVKGKNKNEIIGTVLDITDLKMATDALVAAEHKYQKFFDESPIPTVIFKQNGEILEANFAFSKLVEIAENKVVGKNILTLSSKSSNNTMKNVLQELIKASRFETEISIKLVNGKQVDLMLNAVKLKTDEYIAFYNDISSIKSLTSEIQVLYKRFTNFFEIMNDAVFFVDLKLNQVVYSNPASEEISGFPILEINNPTLYVEKVVHPEDKEISFSAREMLEKEGFSSAEYRIITKSGEIKWVWEKMWVIFDDKNQPIRIDGIISDITKIKESETKIKSALIQEIELNELKSQFISTTSHEFRTPLTSILSSIELLEHYGLRWEETKVLHHINKIKHSVSRIQEQLKDILVLEKARSNKLFLAPEKANLKEFCELLVSSIEDSKNLTRRIKFEYLLEEEFLVFDEKLLEQILANLIGNAIKYSYNDSLVGLTVKAVNGMILFVISDKGIGIPTEDQHQIFDVFFRSKNTTKIEGTGLGLSIVKNALQVYNGDIEFTSNENIGTTFLVRIPILTIKNDEEGNEEKNISN